MFLASPFEIFQAIKNDVKARTGVPVTLVMGVTNDALGYAPDHTAAARGGYAADTVPLIIGTLPFARIHDELVEHLLALASALQSSRIASKAAETQKDHSRSKFHGWHNVIYSHWAWALLPA